MDAVYRFFASLKLAVLVLLGLALGLMSGTFLESFYDVKTAQYWVYQARWFYVLQSLLALNIACVSISRWPWKWKHLPFLVAHLGILILLLGSWLTDRTGLQGMMRLEPEDVVRTIELDQFIFSLSDQNHAKVYAVPWIPPQVKFRGRSLIWQGETIGSIDRYLPYAEPQIVFVPHRQSSNKVRERRSRSTLKPSRKPFAAAHLKLVGGSMGLSQDFWLWEGADSWKQLALGPAQFSIGEKTPWTSPKEASSLKTLLQFKIWSNAQGQLLYSTRNAEGHLLQGSIPMEALKNLGMNPNPGIRTGWKGDLKVLLQEWIADADALKTYVPAVLQQGTQAPPSAIRVRLGQEPARWLGEGEHQTIHLPAWGTFQLGYGARRVMLPFGIRLERFILQYDPGTSQPASYASEVSVFSGVKEDPQLAHIQMNQPLKVRDYYFYQSSYEQPVDPALNQTQVSILSVNRDPGRFYKYFGSLLIVLGSILLFLVKPKLRLQTSQIMILFFAFSQSILTVQANPRNSPLPKDWSFMSLGLTPVQSGGRLKPLDTLARELVGFTTSFSAFENWNPIDLLLSWIIFTKDWDQKSFLPVQNPSVRIALGLDPQQRWVTPQILFQNILFLETAAKSKPSQPHDQELKLLWERLNVYHSVISGAAWPLSPQPGSQAWLPLVQVRPTQELGFDPIYQCFADVLKAYELGDQWVFERASHLLRASILDRWSTLNPHQSVSILKSRLLAEFFYHHYRFFVVASCFYAVAFLCFTLQLVSHLKRYFRFLNPFFLGSLTIGVSVHFFGILLRCWIAGRPPVTNMYESMIWVSFGIVALAGVFYANSRQKIILGIASCLACFGLFTAESAPGILDPTFQTLMPVLRSHFWLMIHVLTITLGYSAFALTFGLANVTLWHWARSSALEKRHQFNQLIYRTMQVGVILIAAGTILGGIWADASWGRFWGWDPKEVWALITLLCYLVLLHGRYAQWVGPFGFAVGSALSFLSVVMAWYGVNFILGTGLHSYGFAQGGTPWVVGLILLELLYIAWVNWQYASSLRTVVSDKNETRS